MKIMLLKTTIAGMLVSSAFGENLNLKSGWNLVGSNQDNININSSIPTAKTVWKYNNDWQVTSPNGDLNDTINNSDFSTFSTVNSGEGFWVNIEQDTNITLSGETPSNMDLNLKSGWNLVSLKGDSDVNMSQYLTDNSIQIVWKYENNNWQAYSPDPTISNTISNNQITPLTKLNIGDGFWVNSNTDINISNLNIENEITSVNELLARVEPQNNSGWGVETMTSFIVEGNYAYVSTDDGFVIFDITDKTNPVQKSYTSTSYYGPYHMTLEGNNLYMIAGEPASLRVYNIDDKVNPLLLDSSSTGYNYINNMKKIEDTVYYEDQYGSYYTMNVSDINNIGQAQQINGSNLPAQWYDINLSKNITLNINKYEEYPSEEIPSYKKIIDNTTCENLGYTNFKSTYVYDYEYTYSEYFGSQKVDYYAYKYEHPETNSTCTIKESKEETGEETHWSYSHASINYTDYSDFINDNVNTIEYLNEGDYSKFQNLLFTYNSEDINYTHINSNIEQYSAQLVGDYLYFTDDSFCIVDYKNILKNKYQDYNAPVITSSSNIQIQENNINVTTITVTDTDSDTFVYSLSGIDADYFNIDSSSGKITFKFDMVPDYDTKQNYNISVSVKDKGENSATQDLTITILEAAVQSEEVTHNGLVYNSIVSPFTGKTWLDRNLGASQVCTEKDDSLCYGDYYQWGRDADGHEKSNSSAVFNELASSITNVGHSNFIVNFNTGTYDWLEDGIDTNGTLRSEKWSKTDGTSICPIGYRVPTIEELKAETTNVGMTESNNLFNSFLKIPLSGIYEYDGMLMSQGGAGALWSTSNDNQGAIPLIYNNIGYIEGRYRTYGLSVRCIKD